jgi:hypothetical protein
MVLGDLEAEHMAVGGQEVYVAGCSKIQGLLCGSYNYGRMKVKGDLTDHLKQRLGIIAA